MPTPNQTPAQESKSPKASKPAKPPVRFTDWAAF